jgi:DNA ligase (NAD+)
MNLPKASPESRIKYLTYRVLYHDDLYYNKDQPDLTDAEYDQLYNKLVELETRYPEHKLDISPTNRVPGLPNSSFKKIKHRFPMYSLAKVHTWEEFLEWDKRIRELLQ